MSPVAFYQEMPADQWTPIHISLLEVKDKCPYMSTKFCVHWYFQFAIKIAKNRDIYFVKIYNFEANISLHTQIGNCIDKYPWLEGLVNLSFADFVGYKTIYFHCVKY